MHCTHNAEINKQLLACPQTPRGDSLYLQTAQQFLLNKVWDKTIISRQAFESVCRAELWRRSPGEVVAHSLRDCLNEHKGSKLALLKIDFRNAFNEVKRSHFVKAASEMFPAMSSWTEWCYGEASSCSMITSTLSSPAREFNKATPWAHCISAAGLWQWSMTFKLWTLSTTNGTWMKAELLVMLICSRNCGHLLRLDYTSTCEMRVVVAGPWLQRALPQTRWCRIKLSWYHIHATQKRLATNRRMGSPHARTEVFVSSISCIPLQKCRHANSFTVDASALVKIKDSARALLEKRFVPNKHAAEPGPNEHKAVRTTSSVKRGGLSPWGCSLRRFARVAGVLAAIGAEFSICSAFRTSPKRKAA